ncbi:MAG: GHKL domain-containing protein [Rikenellaceae bacterium]|nr:GHKL domain-containing protein [Rikenellaceae bacterium]
MFKSIEYKLILWLVLLLAFFGAAVWFAARGVWLIAAAVGVPALYSLGRLRKNYRRYNSNIIFLLNALENGDFSFHFAANKLSRRESELNMMFDRIKEILSGARLEVMENEKFLGIIVESTAAGIAIAEENGSIRVVNKSALRMLGLPVFTHIKQIGAVDASYPDLLLNLSPGKTAQLRVANEREELLISVSVTVVRIRDMILRVFSLTNIGNELEAREMESWIKLIRVMTHEIMNSIAPINSLSETLLEAYEEDGQPSPELREDTLEAFRTINSTAKGLLSFVESYRRFTGVPKPELTRTDINLLVSRTVDLQSASFADMGIKAETLLTGEGSEIMADGAQIGQVLVNLLKNASEAASGRPDAQIRVATRREPGMLVVEVRNNGSPIPPEVEPHIFVPFFTTKDKGTGIGLSLSRYIMRLHGGNLKYHRADQWTVFTLLFPLNGPPA